MLSYLLNTFSSIWYSKRDFCSSICEDCVSIILSFSYPEVRLVSKQWDILYQKYNVMKVKSELLKISDDSILHMNIVRLRHILQYYICSIPSKYSYRRRSLFNVYIPREVIDLTARLFFNNNDVEDAQIIMKSMKKSHVRCWIVDVINCTELFSCDYLMQRFLNFISSVPYMQEMFTYTSPDLSPFGVEKVQSYPKLRFSIIALHRFYRHGEHASLSTAISGRDIACTHEEYVKFVDHVTSTRFWDMVWLSSRLQMHKKYHSE